jgi:SPP1 family predicted phage head-tail adaptor
MSVGKMRTPITITPVVSSVVETHTIDAPGTPFTVRGYVKPLTGRKFFEAAAVNYEHTEVVVVRYRDDINPKCRLFYNGLDHRIESIADIENRHVYLELKCEALSDG